MRHRAMSRHTDCGATTGRLALGGLGGGVLGQPRLQFGDGHAFAAGELAFALADLRHHLGVGRDVERGEDVQQLLVLFPGRNGDQGLPACVIACSVVAASPGRASLYGP